MGDGKISNVSIPESAIMLVAVSPLLEKDLIRPLRSRFGVGISLFAASKLAVT